MFKKTVKVFDVNLSERVRKNDFFQRFQIQLDDSAGHMAKSITHQDLEKKHGGTKEQPKTIPFFGLKELKY